MDSVDGSRHYDTIDRALPPSLLVIVLDTNPHAWALLKPVLPLSKAIANILIFINAHLAIAAGNQVCVTASHSHRAVFLYPPSPALSTSSSDTNGHGDALPDKANKYRPFALVESALLTSLRELISSTTPHDIETTNTTQMAGALTLALSYANRASALYSGIDTSSTSTTVAPDSSSSTPTGLQSRILVLSVSGDLAHQYIPIMNTTFACQRLRIPIDIVKLAGDTVFLQQASDATGGIYLHIRNPRGLLQYLMMAFLPDQISRKDLVAPAQEVVDFRAACFCHRRVVDVGFVCSICLSIFCEVPEGAVCGTCGTHLSLGDYGAKPAVVPRKKKLKKKRPIGNGIETGSVRGTPAPGE